MNNKSRFLVLSVFSVLVLALVTGFANAATLASWSLTDVTTGTPNSANADVTPGTFSASGVNLGFLETGARATSWAQTSSRDDTKYFQIIVQPASGKSLTLQEINFDYERSDTGVANYDIRYSKDGFATSQSIVSGATASTSGAGDVGSLNIHVNNGETLAIRFYGYGATSGAGTWKILANTLNLQGTTASVGGGTTSMSLTKVQDLTRTQNGQVTVQNTGATTLSNIDFVTTGDFTATFSPATISSLAPGASTTVNVIGSLTNLKYGTNTININARSGSVNSNSISYSIENGFCKNGKVGDLSITKFKITNRGEGKKSEWELLDTITIEVKIENTGDDDVDDVLVRLGIFNSAGKNLVNDFDFINSEEDEIDLGDLSDGDDETVTFELKVPADADTGSYRIVAKAYAEGKESTQCTDDNDGKLFEEVSIKKKKDDGKFIAFDNIVASPSEATCGDLVSLSLDLFNVGDKDQDQVKVNLKNSELKIDSSVEIRNNVDQGDRETVRFDFSIPQNAQNKVYTLLLSSDYDYRSGNYRQHSDDDTPVTLKVIGCANTGTGSGTGSGTGTRNAAITAQLGSDAIAGQPLTIRTTITNIGTEQLTYSLDVSDFEDWAELSSVSRRSFSLNAGESQEVTIRLNVKADAEGEQSFRIETLANGKTESREVTVEVSPKQSSGSGITGFSIFGGGENTYLWIIGAVNVILIILIIVVAVRISRR